MTALVPDLTAAIPQQRLALDDAPATTPVAASRRRTWLLVATTAVIVAVMAATTATALVRAGDRGHRLAATKRELAEANTLLTRSKDALASATAALASARSDLSASRADVGDLVTCVNALAAVLVAAAEGDLTRVRVAATETLSACPDVMDRVAPAFGDSTAV